MTSKRALHVRPGTLTELAVDRCFLRLVDRYIRTLSAREAKTVKDATDLLLPPRATLPPLEQIKVANLLWEHHGSPLEAGYRLKEDFKRYLRCETPAEQVKLVQALIEDGNVDVHSSFRQLMHTL